MEWRLLWPVLGTPWETWTWTRSWGPPPTPSLWCRPDTPAPGPPTQPSTPSRTPWTRWRCQTWAVSQADTGMFSFHWILISKISKFKINVFMSGRNHYYRITTAFCVLLETPFFHPLNKKILKSCKRIKMKGTGSSMKIKRFPMKGGGSQMKPGNTLRC